MKLIIDIPEEAYKLRVTNPVWYDSNMDKAIRNGIVISDNATNGDVISTLFPEANFKLTETKMGYSINRSVLYNEDYVGLVDFDLSWWNKPYINRGRTNDN